MTRVRAVAAVGVALGLLCLLVLFSTNSQTHDADAPRHVKSRITVLSQYGNQAQPVWIYITSDRDIRICPDGSGRIEEQLVERSFPTADEEAQWTAAGQPGFQGVNQTFRAGELAYISGSEVRGGIDRIVDEFPSSGDGLRRLATLLAETVPSAADNEAALLEAQKLRPIELKAADHALSITGPSGDGLREVTLVFQVSPARLLSESWQALSARDGLDLAPPFPIFEREVTLFEASACP